MRVTKFISGIAEIASHFDTFILDQWGVLHFGAPAPEHVIETLHSLRAAKKTVIILSNSSRSVSFTRARLEKFGIDAHLYDQLVTSGEMVRQGLVTRDSSIFNNLGNRCFLINAGDDRTLLEGVELDCVAEGAEADFILLANFDFKSRSIDSYDDVLRAYARAGIPMICANPDVVVVNGDAVYPGPGKIAARYAEMRGKVHYIGKPYKPVFAYAFSLVPQALPSRTIMVGDTMEHDIKGGNDMGFATCLTKTGAHSEAFKTESPQRVIDDFSRHYGFLPTYVVEALVW